VSDRDMTWDVVTLYEPRWHGWALVKHEVWFGPVSLPSVLLVRATRDDVDA
jgi:hypothetical protein